MWLQWWIYMYILVKVSINVFGEVATATARQADILVK